MRKDARYLANVRAQYEALPYPARDPEDERKRLLIPPSERLFALNHFCFRGRRDFRGARVLVAGAGTGDVTIFLAEQLREIPGAAVVSIDLSEASNAVARERARIRGLTRIEFLHGSLLDLPGMGLEPFDYINCSGVLHHLADPDEGLNALTAVLKPDGALGLMVYGQYGRTGVYQMQALMRLVNGDEPDIGVKVETTKAMLAALPASNWFKRGEEMFSDHVQFGDAGVYDLFLHEQDRAYTVPELYAFLGRAGLHLIDYCQAHDRIVLDPATYIRDPALLNRIRALPGPSRRAVMELVSGRMFKHHVYAARTPDTVASIDDPDNVPFLVDLRADTHLAIADRARQAPKAPVVLRNAQRGISFLPQPHTAAIFRHLDGRNSLGEIFARVRQEAARPDLTDDDLRADFAPVHAAMASGGFLMLRHRSAPAFMPLPGQPAPS